MVSTKRTLEKVWVVRGTNRFIPYGRYNKNGMANETKIAIVWNHSPHSKKLGPGSSELTALWGEFHDRKYMGKTMEMYLSRERATTMKTPEEERGRD